MTGAKTLEDVWEAFESEAREWGWSSEGAALWDLQKQLFPNGRPTGNVQPVPAPVSLDEPFGPEPNTSAETPTAKR